MLDRTPRPLPITIEGIDRDWLSTALRTRAPEATVRKFEIVDINRGTCTKIRLRLEVDEAGKRAGLPETVILKGGFEPHSRDMWYMHEAEARGYRDVFPVLELHTPACYFADYDDEQRQGIVIMEDLVARGVTFCNPLKPQTHDQVARRLTMLARYHARSWASRELAQGGRFDWVPETTAMSQRHFKQYFGPEEWRRFVESPRGAAASVRFHDVGWMEEALRRMHMVAAPLPHSILHGDTHLGNLYIERDGTPGFFDSLPSRGPAMMEVCYHMTGALDLADRRRWEGSLVQHYLEELARNGVSPPSFDAAMRQFGIFAAKGYCIFLLNESFYQPEAYNTAYVARFSAAMLDHDTVGLLKAVA